MPGPLEFLRRVQVAVAPQPSPYPLGDPGTAQAVLLKAVWPDGPTCPECASPSIRTTSDFRGLLRCNRCRRRFSLRTGTPLERSGVPLDVWVWAIRLHGQGVRGEALATQLLGQTSIVPITASRIAERLDRAVAAPASAPRPDDPHLPPLPAPEPAPACEEPLAEEHAEQESLEPVPTPATPPEPVPAARRPWGLVVTAAAVLALALTWKVWPSGPASGTAGLEGSASVDQLVEERTTALLEDYRGGGPTWVTVLVDWVHGGDRVEFPTPIGENESTEAARIRHDLDLAHWKLRILEDAKRPTDALRDRTADGHEPRHL